MRRGAVVASDAFFPFPDALEVAADAGCTAVIHPGGSKGDEAVLAAAEERGMAVVLTGTRHFRHIESARPGRRVRATGVGFAP